MGRQTLKEDVLVLHQGAEERVQVGQKHVCGRFDTAEARRLLLVRPVIELRGILHAVRLIDKFYEQIILLLLSLLYLVELAAGLNE